MLRHLDLFSGIGGFALAASWTGAIETTQFVEIDPYCQKVLRRHFPGVPIHDDIRTFTAQPGAFDLITGGFPCQDISCANPNGRGLEGERSGLFFELVRTVRECRPRYLILENVPEMLRKHKGRVMGTVLAELSQVGFDAEWQTISAASLGAPHLRERVFIVAANSDSDRRDRWRDYWQRRQTCPDLVGDDPEASEDGKQFFSVSRSLGSVSANVDSVGRRQRSEVALVSHEPQKTEASGGSLKARFQGTEWTTEPGVLRVAHGIPDRVDRIRGLGNAVTPQQAEIPLRRVLELATLFDQEAS